MVFSREEIERRRRILLSIWAYAYEFQNHSIVPDHVFDAQAYLVDLRIDTGRPVLDFWFRAMFQPHTGLWIHKHPELHKIERIYHEHFNTRRQT